LDVIEKIESTVTKVPFANRNWGGAIYTARRAATNISQEIHARLWVLNFSDGQHSLLDIAERSGCRSRRSATQPSLLNRIRPADRAL